jgi:N-acetylglucosamine-6-phosphate deacetylase
VRFLQNRPVAEAIAGEVKAKDYQTKQTIDAQDCYVTAGLFDLQVNGSPQCNLWQDPTAGQFIQLCDLLLKSGVTAFLPTLITDDMEHLKKNIAFLESMGVGEPIQSQPKNKTGKFDASQLIAKPGIHLEGPFLSPQRPGVHPKQYLKPLLMPQLKELARPSVKLMTLAPELDNAEKSIEFLAQKGIITSLGHSDASFEEARRAFAWGMHMITHIFNALPPLHQRRPGAVLAALLDKDVYCCVICDGLHVDPNMVKLLVSIKGVDKVILVTDIASVGTTGGELVGASITLNEAVRNIVNWGIVTFPEAIRMATFNPACAMNLDHCLGQIKSGRRADLIIWDKQTLAIKHVIANGELVI